MIDCMHGDLAIRPRSRSARACMSAERPVKMASSNKGSFIVNFWLMTTGAKSCRDAGFDPSRNHEIIEFADDGSIIIKDKTRFEQQLLGRYFKSKDPKLKKWRRNFTGKGYSQHFRMVDAASCEQLAPDFVCITPSDGICWCEIKESGRKVERQTNLVLSGEMRVSLVRSSSLLDLLSSRVAARSLGTSKKQK